MYHRLDEDSSLPTAITEEPPGDWAVHFLELWKAALSSQHCLTSWSTTNPAVIPASFRLPEMIYECSYLCYGQVEMFLSISPRKLHHT